MISALATVTSESFLLLRRDRVFVPALFAGLVISGFAHTASYWGMEDFDRILFDIGAFGIQLTGSLVALFWGTKLLTEARRDGSVEVELAAPISRPVWLIGKFLGLVLSLLFLAAGLIAIWQVVLLLRGEGWMARPEALTFAYMTLGWLVIGSMGLFLSSFAGHAVALFGAAALWIAGLVTRLVSETLLNSASETTRAVVASLARVWDLQQFNLTEWVSRGSLPPDAELALRAAYGGLLIAAFLTAACITLQKRDIVP